VLRSISSLFESTGTIENGMETIAMPNLMLDRSAASPLVVRDGAIVIRKMMNLSSSFDHRVVDGYHAAEFIQKIKALLEHPAMLFMD